MDDLTDKGTTVPPKRGSRRTSASMSASADTTSPGVAGTSGQAALSTGDTGAQASSLMGRVRDGAKSQLTSQKDRATEGLGSVAQAVRQSTQQLRDQQHDTVARYVEQAADQLEKFSERLKTKDVGELFDDAQRLARRRPALFVGGAFALGLVGARFMKSSSREDRGEFSGYGTSDYPGSGYGSRTVSGSDTAGRFGAGNDTFGTSTERITGTSRDLPGGDSY